MRRALLGTLFVASLATVTTGCATVAQVTTLPDSACHESLSKALARILEGQGEAPPAAEGLAESTVNALQTLALGPRPFLVEAPSGVDYSFFVERKGSTCVLRLYGRQKGFISYTNNLTYIATEPLAPCECSE